MCDPRDTGCRILFNLMLVTKLKSLLGLAAIAGLSLISPTPSFAASCSGASFYGAHGDGYAWRTTASGEPMNPSAMTTAHRYLPFGTRLRVTNPNNGKSVIVRVNDRGPFVGGRELDLSYGAFTRIASASQGVARVCYSRL